MRLTCPASRGLVPHAGTFRGGDEGNSVTKFEDLGLSDTLLRALADEGYTTPTPIQAQSIPALLEGKDLLGIAQTGTGKTAAFALPILHRQAANKRPPTPRGCRALVLAPTRELALQIGESFKAYGKQQRVTVAVIIGGVGHAGQVRAMSRGVDVLVATPGRLLDHMGTNAVRLDATEVVVLDEADHMLDLGFIVPIRKIVAKLPKPRHTLFFSATMPREIETLANEMLRDPVRVSVAPVATTAERVDQRVMLVEHSRKRDLLVSIAAEPSVTRALVFTRTKRGADRVCEHLEGAGITAAAIHGNKSQGQRERALEAFREGRIRILVATDIAARGIDVDGVSHVVNFDLPEVPEAYVHRIGRTARAGATGVAIAFCSDDEAPLLRDIEKLTRQAIPRIDRRQPGAQNSAPASVRHTPRPPQAQRRPGGAPPPGGFRGRPQNRRRANA